MALLIQTLDLGLSVNKIIPCPQPPLPPLPHSLYTSLFFGNFQFLSEFPRHYHWRTAPNVNGSAFVTPRLIEMSHTD